MRVSSWEKAAASSAAKAARPGLAAAAALCPLSRPRVLCFVFLGPNLPPGPRNRRLPGWRRLCSLGGLRPWLWGRGRRTDCPRLVLRGRSGGGIIRRIRRRGRLAGLRRSRVLCGRDVFLPCDWNSDLDKSGCKLDHLRPSVPEVSPRSGVEHGESARSTDNEDSRYLQNHRLGEYSCATSSNSKSKVLYNRIMFLRLVP